MPKRDGIFFPFLHVVCQVMTIDQSVEGGIAKKVMWLCLAIYFLNSAVREIKKLY